MYGAIDDEVCCDARPMLAEPLHHLLHVIPVGPLVLSHSCLFRSLQNFSENAEPEYLVQYTFYVGVRLKKKNTT